MAVCRTFALDGQHRCPSCTTVAWASRWLVKPEGSPSSPAPWSALLVLAAEGINTSEQAIGKEGRDALFPGNKGRTMGEGEPAMSSWWETSLHWKDKAVGLWHTAVQWRDNVVEGWHNLQDSSAWANTVGAIRTAGRLVNEHPAGAFRLSSIVALMCLMLWLRAARDRRRLRRIRRWLR